MENIEDIKIHNRETLPEGWERVKLGEYAKIQGGFAFKSDEYIKHGIPLIRISNVGKGKIVLEKVKYLKYEIFNKAKLFQLKEGDILIGMTGDLGKVSKITKKYLPALLNQRVGRFLIKKADISNDFLFYIAISNEFQNNLNLYFYGGAQANISPSKIENITIYKPKSYKEQQEIAEILETVDKTIEKTDAIIEKYKRIKQGLMQDLLTRGIDKNGQIRSEETHKFKDSPLGRIPEEWEVVTVSDFASNEKNAIVDGPFGSNLKIEHYREVDTYM